MKKKKLIPKHQIGKKILNFLESFGNAQINNDPAVAAASGWKYNQKTNKYEQSKENLNEAEELRNNLSDISIFSPTHPMTALMDRIAIPSVTKVLQKTTNKLMPKKIKSITRTQPKQIINITKENASQITDQQWDEAFYDALEKGNIEKLKKLRALHFQVKSGNDPQVFAHSTYNSFNEFDQQFFGKTDEGFNGKGFYFSTTRIPENPALHKMAKGPNGEIPYMNYGPKKKYVYLKGNREFDVGNPDRNFFEESNTVGFVGLENAKVSEVIVGKPSQIKSARTLTYDDEGILIPLSKRDNFYINDFRYKYGGFIKYNK